MVLEVNPLTGLLDVPDRKRDDPRVRVSQMRIGTVHGKPGRLANFG